MAHDGVVLEVESVSKSFGALAALSKVSFAVRQGQTLKRGDVIGYVGATGRVTGAHLHYEIILNGDRINPIKLLTGR